jgi:hypothetical protein
VAGRQFLEHQGNLLDQPSPASETGLSPDHNPQHVERRFHCPISFIVFSVFTGSGWRGRQGDRTMDPTLVLIAASTLATAAVGIFAVIRTNRLRAQLEDRILMLEMELSTVRRDFIDASATQAASQLPVTEGGAIDGYEQRILQPLTPNVDLDSGQISIQQQAPSTALVVADQVVTRPIAEIDSVGSSIAAMPSSLHPLRMRTWESPAPTQRAVRSGPLEEQVAINSLAKVGVALLVLGVAFLPWSSSNRLNSRR